MDRFRIAEQIAAYAGEVARLEFCVDEGQAENVLHWRDRIEGFRRAGIRFAPADEERLAAADRQLYEQRHRLLSRWPGVFSGNNLPPDRWWWHLDRTSRPDSVW